MGVESWRPFRDVWNALLAKMLKDSSEPRRQCLVVSGSDAPRSLARPTDSSACDLTVAALPEDPQVTLESLMSPISTQPRPPASPAPTDTATSFTTAVSKFSEARTADLEVRMSEAETKCQAAEADCTTAEI